MIDLPGFNDFKGAEDFNGLNNLEGRNRIEDVNTPPMSETSNTFKVFKELNGLKTA